MLPRAILPTGKDKAAHLSTTEKERVHDMLLRNIDSLLRLPDWRLTTAEILYHMPDHPTVLQSFIWQKIDHAPDFPLLHSFLAFWRRDIEGPLHSIRVASAALTRPAEFRYADGEFRLH